LILLYSLLIIVTNKLKSVLLQELRIW